MERNAAGHIVGPERRCLRKDGTPKKIYADDEITAWQAKHGGGRYEPYQCDKGHWHIGNKLRRPIVVDGAR
jgi:hypothetical protein